MLIKNKTIVVCGAGIAGVATAYYLSKSDDSLHIILIDKNQALSLTTSKSGENFRDFWPQKCMRDLSIHSIQLMKALRNEFGDDAFNMTFSGYNFISCNNEEAIFAKNLSETAEQLFEENIDADSIATKYPYLSKDVKSIVTIKNAGNIDVNALGTTLLKAAKKNGVKEVQGEIIAITKSDSKYKVILDSKTIVNADKIVIASGPFLNNIANMIGLEFPIENTLQRKFIIPDLNNIIPRNMPFTIYADTQHLNWSEEEISYFNTEEKYKWLLEVACPF